MNDSRASKQLVLGGARSGKSRYAESLALDISSSPTYVATGAAGDAEMAARIAHHRKRRGNQWILVEEPVALGQTIRRLQTADACILVDCLTLWLSNCLHQQCWEAQRADFLHALADARGSVLLISNEVGSGVVPLGELSRCFVDESGRLHQELAMLCERVTLVVAGLPVVLKGS